MKNVFLTLATSGVITFANAGLAQTRPSRGPTAGAFNAPPGSLNDTSNGRNLYRQKIVNDFIHRRGAPQTVSATVYSLSFFEPFWMLWNKWESTFGMLNRALYAKMPFGQKQHYSGLHPRYIEYRFHDRGGDLLYAQCFLDFYTSRSIPGRIFIRSHHCIEQDFARTTAGYKGYHFAGIVEVLKGKVTKYKDLTAEWLKDASLDSDTKFVSYLTDPTVFEDPNAKAGSLDDDDDGPPNS